LRSKRTNIDFKDHEVLVTKTDEVLIHYLKKPNTICDSIKYINCGGILAVTGDYGNWIFCREFHPSPDGYVSDGYWYEKLKILSTQDVLDFDGEGTKKAIQEKINEYIEEKGDDIDEDVIQYYEECMLKCDEHLLDYEHYAYREQPYGMDYDDVITIKDYKYWLKAVYDGFDEICGRLKMEQTVEDHNEINK
jgi:hypothetical protein